jgi:hypothetical protein
MEIKVQQDAGILKTAARLPRNFLITYSKRFITPWLCIKMP